MKTENIKASTFQVRERKQTAAASARRSRGAGYINNTMRNLPLPNICRCTVLYKTCSVLFSIRGKCEEQGQRWRDKGDKYEKRSEKMDPVLALTGWTDG